MIRDEPNLYELLEVDPGASEEEIRRAHKRMLGRFDARGTVVYGLFRTEQLQALRRRLDNAHDVLLDPDARRRYDRELFPDRRPTESVEAAAERPAPPSDPIAALGLPPEAEVNGHLLKRVREICHLSIEDVCDSTKIGMHTLRCIENEAFEDLPARVYLKGFLKQIARELGIDADRVCDGYLLRYDEWRAAKG